MLTSEYPLHLYINRRGGRKGGEEGKKSRRRALPLLIEKKEKGRRGSGIQRPLTRKEGGGKENVFRVPDLSNLLRGKEEGRKHSRPGSRHQLREKGASVSAVSTWGKGKEGGE